ncbi:FAD-dependent oxidoreductase [Rhodococcus sp. BP-349]|uniref:NAD(P)/FAD-dependent oxidoreductase n=1 Tax=unclassified Rhodococcus (in: high G+C Gram-positive bacteria) TaxID=192944 RepID=UPI001C9B59F8|nr:MULTISPECIES: FAD-dependent oxidoreductase [unclassified Rhodococcus (in: high G+C Gram-positive bacteria)]MBY6537769.1 FAD-dependent oxidoreductase [Rhodococcus sp. BP-363]MBY6542106.1 FAD-dependent oxidoreductase [Rhodococcus sp. BP-369]MBY6561336.1 FAD-dependent oxidoreductase [Rhodococcus sp. BP-370]MBY6575628.1 FAD-dependent oxidoreductase [Rhodococcus sp. BP-364]MBY6584929.1 FAD-dependent oxidoreductase [Rhodococcus sp. BP-358]
MSSTHTTDVLVIGAGQGGGEAAVSLRRLGHTGAILVAGDEPLLPYRRPPLSKGLLTGEVELDDLLDRRAEAYESAGIDTLLGARAVALDTTDRVVTFADGGTATYETLILATGARARTLASIGITVPDGAPNLHYLRSVADAERLRPQVRAGARLVVVGGGYVGLEVAASSRGRGVAVTVIEGQDRLLARVTAPVVSEFYRRVHHDEGVEILLDTSVAGFTFAPDGHITEVLCDDGTVLPCDLVVAGIGGVANVELAAAAGLLVENGIVVDEHCRTSDPHVLAIGDCAAFPSVHAGTTIRLESVPNALEHARVAAATVMKAAAPTQSPPWFWSDQYDLKLQMVGLSAGHDQVAVRGDMSARSFIAFYLREGIVVAADAVNCSRDFGWCKKIVALQQEFSVDQLQDTDAALKDIARGVSA